MTDETQRENAGREEKWAQDSRQDSCVREGEESEEPSETYKGDRHAQNRGNRLSKRQNRGKPITKQMKGKCKGNTFSILKLKI